MHERLISKGVDKNGVRYSLVEFGNRIGKFIELDGKNADIVSYVKIPQRNLLRRKII